VSNYYYQLPGGRVTALDAHSHFPPLDAALIEPNGLIAIGGELSPERLLEAYRRGIFPWFSADEPVMWWSPNPRMVLFPDELKISHSLAKTLKKNNYEVRFNTAFREVMQACAETARLGQDGTWITPDIINGYEALHNMGYAISVETWINGELAGGLYGVTLGKMFYGESMFHHKTDASKIAFVHLVNYLKAQDFGMIDCQMKTTHLASLGAREISRDDFSQRLSRLVNVSS